MTTNDRGAALIMTLIAMAVLSGLGLGLALSSSIERLSIANYRRGVAAGNAADAALEIAIRDLAAIDDWTAVLSGARRSSVVDGGPGGVRTLPEGGSIDLMALTSQLTCGRTDACSDARIRTSTFDRPWGENNPVWQLFVHAPLAGVDPQGRTEMYVVVWVGDDAGEADGDPRTDGSDAGRSGRHAVRARVEVFGMGGLRRGVAATLARQCRDTEDGDVCLPGIHVQSWHPATALLP